MINPDDNSLSIYELIAVKEYFREQEQNLEYMEEDLRMYLNQVIQMQSDLQEVFKIFKRDNDYD